MRNARVAVSQTLLLLLFCCQFIQAQQANSNTNFAVPPLVRFSGLLTDPDGKPPSDVVGVTFSLYKDEQGGAPLWMETQNVRPTADGHFTVMLGAASGGGLPLELFTSGETQWLGVQAQGQAEQARVLLVSVPYAMKAGDAATLNGLPPSAFVLAAPPTEAGPSTPFNASADDLAATPIGAATVGGTGTTNFIPIWTGSAAQGNSAFFQTSGNIGLGNTAPAAKLDVSGSGIFRGSLQLPATGAATATTKFNSQPFDFMASSFKSSTAAAVSQHFRWQAEPTGNDTTAPSGTLNLLFGAGTTTPTETGLRFASNGVITFASGQTFPGTGPGTVKSVALTAPSSDFTVSGSPVTGSGTLGLNWKVAPTNFNTANTIVKRDSTGSFNAGSIVASSINAGVMSDSGDFVVSGNSFFVGNVGLGTSAPQAQLNLNFNGTANSDTLLVGNSTTKGLRLRDTGNAVDLESLGVPLFVNFATGQNTFLFNSVGIGTSAPQAELNLNSGGKANADTLLLGNNSSRGLQLRDNGNGMDIESIGVPLNVNFVTQQPLFLNPNGGQVFLGIGGDVKNGTAPILSALTVGAFNESGTFTSIAASNDVFVLGNLFVSGTKDFKIDHPLDPLNKYLVHASIESSEVLNQYSGNVVLDGKGEARVEFPDWFAVINEDFRYQLTAVGAPGPNLYIAEEIKDNSFTIAGGRPGMKVSWQVTARRNDLYMRAHPFVVEKDKSERERGRYSNPELYGAPAEQGIFPGHKFAAPDNAAK